MTDYKVVDDINSVENLRRYSYGFGEDINKFYSNSLTNKTMIAIGAYIDEKLVGAAYISSYLTSLYIENIFVDKEYRNNKVATNLIKYVITNKDIFENFFGKEFITSKLEPNSSEIIRLYERLGYSEPNSFNIMNKRI